MICISINENRFAYDIHSLVKAFYPAKEVKVLTGREAAPGRGACEGAFAVEAPPAPGEISLDIRLEEPKGYIEITLRRPDGTKTTERAACTATEPAGKAAPPPGDVSEDAAPPSAEVRTDASTDGSAASHTTSKNVLKQLLYRMLVRENGHALPWGALTGIRPVKIPMHMLAQGKRDEEIRAYLRDTHFVSAEKISLSLEIAKRERAILKTIDVQSGYSLYIGIPFCPTTCAYCSFTSYPIGRFAPMVDDYLTCLEKEIDDAARLMAGRRLDTIYIGGGTPTTLTPARLDRLLCRLEAAWDLNAVRELTVESGRPDSILDDPGKLRVLKRHHVNRISVNPQTMRQETLDRIGRRHTVQQTIDAFHMARETGFDSINMDIILGLPGEGPDDVKYTMEEIARLAPEDLTVHSLAIKRGSRLKEALSAEAERKRHAEGPDAGGLRDADSVKADWKGRTKASDAGNLPDRIATHPYDDRGAAEEMMRIVDAAAREMGLAPYYLYRQKNMTGNMENVGYAQPGVEDGRAASDAGGPSGRDAPALGKAGLYNILIMEEVEPIVALGAGSVSKAIFPDGRIERCDNVKDVALYMKRIDEMIARRRSLFHETAPS